MDQLVAERRRRDWTQDNIARRCGVSKQAVCRWETEDLRTPRLTTILKYANALGMTLALIPKEHG
jgi:transcriptional regulator with XRE-family HTH domain